MSMTKDEQIKLELRALLTIARYDIIIPKPRATQEIKDRAEHDLNALANEGLRIIKAVLARPGE